MSGNGKAFCEKLDHDLVFFDGSMGTMLQSGGPASAPLINKPPSGWKVPEELNLTSPDTIAEIHRLYLEAGSDVILTNTFGANRLKLEESGLDTGAVISAAVALARKAVSSFEGRFVALDIGPTGKLLEPMGSTGFDEVYEAFAEAAKAGEAAGADIAVIETMSDLYELKAAVLAVKENTSLPVIASATFLDTNRTLTGADPATVVAVLEGLGAVAVGFNCGGDLAHAGQLAKSFLAEASVPVFMEPNAGIPAIENGQAVFRVSAREFAEKVCECAKLGIRVLGDAAEQDLNILRPWLKPAGICLLFLFFRSTKRLFPPGPIQLKSGLLSIPEAKALLLWANGSIRPAKNVLRKPYSIMISSMYCPRPGTRLPPGPMSLM
ncbi:homocysteine S-methyltransferase family protein [Brucepastera parasyntrophica]|uniref:homocysteine S-methyltransferase family protein n=1 Tax=Brucepastera parasyntrophica TaxID=2880008 RepID=UPI00210D3E2E|nr:homocysteine S-methyltransferase family protein [Brucepastera parasyntrophica]ULQ60539.1 homocysteine S-methyltransferase family protein [Brucepastera parasyntrophica]